MEVMKAIINYGRLFFRKPAETIVRKCPGRFKGILILRVKRRMECQYAETEKQTEQRAEEFLIKEGMLIFWGIVALALVIGGLAVYQLLEPESPVFERNSFGKGEKRISILLQKGEQEREYSLILEEYKLSGTEEQSLKTEFFDRLKEQMAGENISLQKVTQGLCFESTLSGWPMYITYEPEDTGYIQFDGSLGKKVNSLKTEETAQTHIKVTAEYKTYLWNMSVAVQVEKQRNRKSSSPFSKAVRELQETEKQTREQKTYTLPVQTAGDIHVERQQSVSLFQLFLFGVVIILLLLMRNIFGLSERDKVCRKETVRDFSLIVHLLTLYMGAGLSFSSAIHRISLDYLSRTGDKKKYAFDEIVRMDTRLRLGEGQQEVCMQWGRKFKEPSYQKLSLTLLQVMEKGTKEGRELLNQMEQDSFRQRLDHARTEGEEASTKLLFPMILLLGMVMALVMFPAIVRFQGF